MGSQFSLLKTISNGTMLIADSRGVETNRIHDSYLLYSATVFTELGLVL
ncbi:MAG TPA: hypothetical protein PLI52_04600 [Prochlorococcaceae cyanobacterium AMR_MDS_5431]|nr:hypothetical protein [Prochlorococcaceae cyanobacterium AMR_MDS_5431]